MRNAILSALEIDHVLRAASSMEGVRLIADGSERRASRERRARRAVGRRDDVEGRKLYVLLRLKMS